jgi:antibiotic biosynthesis monooxygenase (ABM) superfamily enzyme
MSANTPPSRHRHALMVWIAVLPTLTALQLLLGGILQAVAVYLRPLIMATLTVPIVIYVLLPALQQLLTHLTGDARSNPSDAGDHLERNRHGSRQNPSLPR